MFTGLVQAVGVVRRAEPNSKGLRLEVDVGSWGYAATARAGDSVSVSGVCLTVVGKPGKKPGSKGPVFEFDVVPETLDKTRLGALAPGDRVNLEHAATASTFMGGHLVQGHVDGLGRVAKVQRGGAGGWRVWVEAPAGVRKFLVSKGSVCVEGVSLTVAGVTSKGFWVALIPVTLKDTTLGALRVGDRVNLEMDVIAKMVAVRVEAALKRKKTSRG